MTQLEDAYHALSKYHDNLRIIEGFDKSFNTKIIRKADFVFKITGVMAHTVGYKAEKELVKKPHSELNIHRNANILTKAMANILCRHFNIS